MASGAGWVGLSSANFITPKSVKALMKSLDASDTKVILFIDYVEELSGDNAFDRIHELITRRPDQFRLVATCRRSFLDNTKLAPKRLHDQKCQIVDLTPSYRGSYAEWLTRWRTVASDRILPEGIESGKIATPALAAILAFDSTRDGIDPGQMHVEGAWVTQLLKRSISNFDQSVVVSDEVVARVLQCFPMSDGVRRSIGESVEPKTVLDAFAKDGWSQRDRAGVWRLGHDLLCDLPLLRYLTAFRAGEAGSIRGLLEFALVHESRGAASTALNRINAELVAYLGIPDTLALLRDVVSPFAEASDFPLLAAQILETTCHSLSLNAIEKLRVFFSAPELSQFQFVSLDRVFDDEVKAFRELFIEHRSDVTTTYFEKFGADKTAIQVSVQNWLNKEKDTSISGWFEYVFGDKDIFGAFSLVAHANQLGQEGLTTDAIATYDDLLARYGDSDVPALQEQCAKALVNKGFCFGQLDRSEDEIATFEDVASRYGDSDVLALQEKCAMALANSAEMYLLLRQNAKAIACAEAVKSSSGVGDQKAAIMPFLIWFANGPVTPLEICNSIDALDNGVQFAWDFDELATLIDEMTKEKQIVTRSFIAYFEGQIDRDGLEKHLNHNP